MNLLLVIASVREAIQLGAAKKLDGFVAKCSSP